MNITNLLNELKELGSFSMNFMENVYKTKFLIKKEQKSLCKIFKEYVTEKTDWFFFRKETINI